MSKPVVYLLGTLTTATCVVLGKVGVALIFGRKVRAL